MVNTILTITKFQTESDEIRSIFDELDLKWTKISPKEYKVEIDQGTEELANILES